jgi:hypothetical protein
MKVGLFLDFLHSDRINGTGLRLRAPRKPTDEYLRSEFPAAACHCQFIARHRNSSFENVLIGPKFSFGDEFTGFQNDSLNPISH